MVIDAEDKSRAGRAVDQSKEMLFARCELRFEVTSRACGRVVSASVDDNAVCSGEICCCLFLLIGDERCLMDVVLDQDWSQVDVPIGTIWSVNNEWTDSTL